MNAVFEPVRLEELPGVTNGRPVPTPFTAGRPQAAHIGADDQAPAVRGISGGRVGPVPTMNAGSAR